jgi:hypothetical protein
MLLSEARKSFKQIGFKVKVKSFSFGRHASIYDAQGNMMPSIFTSETFKYWQPAIALKEKVAPVFDDNSSDKVYGFGGITV